MKALRNMSHVDWETYVQTAALQLIGWEHPKAAARLAEMARDQLGPEQAADAFETLATIGVSELLPRIQAPTLVAARMESKASVEIAPTLVAAIPDARLTHARGSSVAAQLGDSGDLTEAIDRFLDELTPDSPSPTS
jgi:hypothetical protein